jgi:hypothetical protein
MADVVDSRAVAREAVAIAAAVALGVLAGTAAFVVGAWGDSG